MDFKIEKKEFYTLIVFFPESAGAKDLLKELTPFIAEGSGFFAFDFTLLKKTNIKFLATIESSISFIKQYGKKIAICCSDPNVRSVLEVAGFLSGTFLFSNEKELSSRVKSYLNEDKSKQKGEIHIKEEPQKAKEKDPHDIKNLFKINYDFNTLLICIGIIIVLFFFIKINSHITTTEKKLDLINTSVDSLKTTFINKSAEEEILQELQAATIDSANKIISGKKTK